MLSCTVNLTFRFFTVPLFNANDDGITGELPLFVVVVVVVGTVVFADDEFVIVVDIETNIYEISRDSTLPLDFDYYYTQTDLNSSIDSFLID